MRSNAGYDPMNGPLDTQDERIQIPVQLDEADTNTEDLYLASSPERNLSESPMAGDSGRTRSMTPLFVGPEDGDTSNSIEWVTNNKSGTSAKVLAANVKAQPTEIYIVDTVDAANVNDGGCCQRPVLPIDEVRIKEEDDGDFEWTWKNARTEIITITDDEHDAPSQPSAHLDDINSAIAPATSPNKLLLKKALLIKRKQRQPLTPANIAKMEEIQKALAEKATGRPLVGVVGSLFKGVHTVQKSAAIRTPLETSNNDRISHEPSDTDEDQEEAFHQVKKNYGSKKRKRVNTMEDDILFLRAVKAENLRKSRVKKEQALEKVQDEADTIAFFSGHDEGLAEGAGMREASSLKRPFQAMVETDSDVWDPEEADFSRQIKWNASSNPNKRRHHEVSKPLGRDPVTTKEVDASMREGFAIKVGKDQLRTAREAKRRATGSAKPRRSEKSKAKEKPDIQPPLKIKKTRKSKEHRGPSMTNFASLVGRDVIADAQANADKGDQPTFTDHRKDQALKELIASLPEETRKTHRTDTTALLKATKSFNGHGAMKSDGNGGWKLKGMKTSLYHYQLLGAAFMRDRENGQDKPLGGILADEMGFGKTLMTISCIVDGRPDPGDRIRTTLIIATPALVTQWMNQILLHTEEGVIDDVMRYSAGSRLLSNNVVKSLQKYDCVVTTFSQVLKSYPKCNLPKGLSDEEKQDWWAEHFEKYKGPLHRIMWHRVIIDEAQYIKNHESRTAIACRGLMARHRWLLSGTPIQNDITEFFSYFAWLKVNHTGSFKTFKKNFCAKGSSVAMTRLHSFLNSFMCRRTHLDTIFGAPILKLPASEQTTTYVDFTELERSVYDIVSHRFIERINRFSAQGILESKYRHIFTLFLRLRQMTGHILMVQETIEDLLEHEDIEKLRKLTANVQDHTSDKTTILQLRKVLANSKRCTSLSADANGIDTSTSNTHTAEDLDTGGSFGVISVNFDKYLRTLHDTSNWTELNSQLSCRRCRQPAEDPWITSCQHIFCRDCLVNQHREATLLGEENATCCECRQVYTGSTPYIGLAELGTEGASTPVPNKPGKRRRPSKDPEDPLRWIEMDGQLLPSAKTTAIKAQIVNWKKEAPGEKIIIFTIFHNMIHILSRIFDQEKWGYCQYHGKMSHTARDAAISSFEKDEKKGILIASLKCGGVGLNLVMATKVFNVDLWWNCSVEQQAYCRVFRIGQERETHIQRVVVRGTIDEKLLAMQKRKDEIIKRALGDDGKAPDKLTVPELLSLFGRVEVDDNGKAFIWPDDDA